jgi:hypothetical protein
MENLLNFEFANALRSRLSESLSAAYERCREIDNNEDSSLSEHIAAGGEAERLQNLLDRLDAAFELHNELIEIENIY